MEYYSATKMILLIAVLVGVLAPAAKALRTCSPYKYEPGSSLEANILTILESIRTVTANAPGRSYTIRLPSPNVIGFSSCHTDIAIEDCISCISSSVDDTKDQCAGAVAATNWQDVCSMFYAVE